MPERGNISDELDYLSGTILAHENFMVALAKGLAATGVTDEDSLRTLLVDLDLHHEDQPDHPEFDSGYRETLAKLQDLI